MTGRDSRGDHEAEAARLAGRIQHTLISNVLTVRLWEAHVAECLEFKFHAAMIPPASGSILTTFVEWSRPPGKFP